MKFMNYYLSLLAILVLFSLNVYPAKMEDKLDRNRVNSYISTIMDRHGIPGVALAIIQNGKVTHKKYYGKASLVHDVPISEKTIFRLYSTTKLFVATGIFQLIEQEKLSLEDNATKFVDGLPKEWHPVKVKHLLTHSSGLPDMSPFIKFQDLNEEQAKAVVFKEKLKSALGEKYSYNQTNFWLLQKIIEKVSGKPFSEFILRNQFGEKRDGVLFNADSRDIIPNRSIPYFPFAKGRIQIEGAAYSGDYLMSANGLNITLNEFIKWNQRFDRNEFLNSKTRDLMWTPFVYKQKRDFAYSWNIHTINKIKSYGFTGSFVTGFRKFPKDNFSIILLANGMGQFFQIDDVIDYIAGIVDKDLNSRKIEVNELLIAGITSGKVDDTISRFRKWKNEVPGVSFEGIINSLGYTLARSGNFQDAVKIFLLNTREYPNSFNVWDSLGEGYEMSGNIPRAIKFYKKSLELNKENKHAIDKIKALSKVSQ